MQKLVSKILAIVISLTFSSCLKNEDGIANGPKAQVVIANYVVNNAAFDVSFDNSSLTSTPLSFGSTTGSTSNLYTNLSAGTHAIRLSSGTNVPINNLLSLGENKNYSLFVFDTLKSAGVKTLLLTDEITPIDTLGQGRFLAFIPTNDTLKIIFIRNGIGAAVSGTYIGKKSTTGLEVNFSFTIVPGNYRLELQRNNVAVFQQPSFTILPGKVYSFIAKGVVNGTGAYQETIAVLQHN